MKKTQLLVPTMIGQKEIDYLSDWKDFDSNLPQGKVILSKGVCGCGATEYYLRSNKPVLLASPRIAMIHSKLADNGEFPPHFHCYEPIASDKRSDNPRPYPIYYYSREDGNDRPDITRQKFRQFIIDCQQTLGFVPKIIVTFDSFCNVITVLQELGVIEMFDIVVDEATSIFTDARQKGLTYLNFIGMLDSLTNHIVYVSATHIREEELDMLPEFCNIPYVCLVWHPSKLETFWVTPKAYNKIVPAIKEIIESYRQKGYFQRKYVNGNIVQSTEAVFFLNNVAEIIRIIKSCKLSNQDTRIICSGEQDSRLNDVGMARGYAPSKKTYKAENKPFTFVTRASFEGADFYSDCSSTYVFANPTQECLCLDISIDLPQIAGRCRSRNNPFRTDIWYYYKTNDKIDTQFALNMIEDKMSKTQEFINSIQVQPEMCDMLLRKLVNAQKIEKYKDDYLDVQTLPDGSKHVVCNNYVYCQDRRAVTIKAEQYKTSYELYGFMHNSGFCISNPFLTYGAREQQDFCREFNKDKDFTRRMKLYAETIEQHPELKAAIEYMTQIPMAFKMAYNSLGAEKLKALSYKESNIEREILQRKSWPNVKAELDKRLAPGQWYSCNDVKRILNDVYASLGIKRSSNKLAPASEIIDYFSGAVEKNKYGQRGYLIL